MTSRRPLKVVGQPLPVKDAREKVTGELKFAVDMVVHGMAHGQIVRSPHPHARIVAVDTSRALALPGVHAVLTHEDTPRHDWEAAWFNYRGKVLDGTARFVGDEVAAVAAETPQLAKQASELIDIEYEPLPPVLDVDSAMHPDAPQVRPEGNIRPPSTVEWGDVQAIACDADHEVECDIHFQSQQYAPLGRNACIAEWTGDRVTLWTATQTPSELRDSVHEALGVALSKVRVIATPSGSSFGQWWSNNFMLLTVLLAKKARRPVKIELDNEECMSTVKRRHEERTRGRMGCTRTGELTVAEFDHVIDNGAYGFKDDVGYAASDLWSGIKHGRFRVRGVNTNRVTAGCMRGVGDCTLGAAVERLADQLAERVGVDPVDFRLRNQIRAGDTLHKTGSNEQNLDAMKAHVDGLAPADRESWPALFRLSSGDTRAILERGAKQFRFHERWNGWGTPSGVEGSRCRAVGVGTGAHFCGVEDEGNVSAVVRLNPDGSVNLHCSVGRQGQGSETTQAQVAAETLGVAFNRVEVEAGDTDSCPWNHGSIASNTMYRTGWATHAASMDARRQLLSVAAREFFENIAPEGLDITDGFVHPIDQPASNRCIGIGDVLQCVRCDSLGQTSSIVGRPDRPMPPATTIARHFSAHFVEVEVDRETGQVRILDYLAAQDSGTVVNPQVLKNQVIGAAVCGLGLALYESLQFDTDTGAVINGNLLDYKLLRIADFPAHAEVLFEESWDPVGPFGAREAGEAPIAAAVSAVSQAVYNAVGCWVDIPMTPERIVRALGGV